MSDVGEWGDPSACDIGMRLEFMRRDGYSVRFCVLKYECLQLGLLALYATSEEEGSREAQLQADRRA